MGGFDKFRKFLFDQGLNSPIFDLAAGDFKQAGKTLANNAAMLGNAAGAYYGVPVNLGRPFDGNPDTPIMAGQAGFFDSIAPKMAGMKGGGGSGGGGSLLDIFGQGGSASGGMIKTGLTAQAREAPSPMPGPDGERLPPLPGRVHKEGGLDPKAQAMVDLLKSYMAREKPAIIPQQFPPILPVGQTGFNPLNVIPQMRYQAPEANMVGSRRRRGLY